MSTDPYRIDSDEYSACWTFLQNNLMDLPKRMRSVVQRRVDGVGSFKAVYYQSENQVYMLEIGPKAFLDGRDKVMDKLFPFRDNSRVIIPIGLETYRIPKDELGSREDAYCILSEARKCTEDLKTFVNTRVSKRQLIDVRFFLLEFSKLSDVLLEMIAKGVYFTDIKLSNIMYCDDHLALIDLDSVVTVSSNPEGENVPITDPAARAFENLYRMIVTSTGEEEFKDDLHFFYSFYTLYAFSVMVFQFYFRASRRVPEANLPSRRAWKEEVDNEFPLYVAGHRAMKRILLLSYDMVAFTYSMHPSKASAERVLQEWDESLEKALSKQEAKKRKRKRRMEKLSVNPTRRPTLLF